jgi:5'(3')-deoxyribonucleotidase
MIIYVDMDGTLCKTYKGLENYIKKLSIEGKMVKPYNFSIEKENLVTDRTVDWLMAGGFTKEEAVSLRYDYYNNKKSFYYHVNYWKNLPPLENAIEVFNWLNDYHDVYILTSAFKTGSDGCIIGKTRWIKKNLPKFDMSKLIYNHNKHLMIGDLIIEDLVSVVEKFRGKRILIDYPYNRGYEDCCRVNNWKEIPNIVKQIEDELKLNDNLKNKEYYDSE